MSLDQKQLLFQAPSNNSGLSSSHDSIQIHYEGKQLLNTALNVLRVKDIQNRFYHSLNQMLQHVYLKPTWSFMKICMCVWAAGQVEPVLSNNN